MLGQQQRLARAAPETPPSLADSRERGTDVKTVTTKLEDALCANHEILTLLPPLLERLEVPQESAATIHRAMQMFQAGLLAATLVPQEVDELTVEEMLASHAEIAAAVATALELAQAPRTLGEQIAAVFADFATGLRSLRAA